MTIPRPRPNANPPPIKHWLKASLISAAALPAGGLFMVRQHLLGLAILIPNLVAVVYLLDFYLGQTLVLWKRALRGDLPLNPWVIKDLIMARPTDPAENHTLTLFLWLWLLTYVLGIVVSAIAGYRLDVKEKRAQENAQPRSRNP